MKSIFLTLSFFFLLGCDAKDAQYPDELLTIIDLANGECRDYKLVDAKQVKFHGPIAHHSLWIEKNGKVVPNPMCEGLVGYRPRAFKNIQNWARDVLGKMMTVLDFDQGSF